MTVDLVRMDQNAIDVLGGANEALDRLAAWVEAARNAHQLVAPLVETAFVPESYRPKVDPRATPEQKEQAKQIAIANATAAVLQGITLGLDPMTALQQIYIVHGRPGLYAKMMVALAQGHGHEVWDEDLSDSRAVVCGRRKGSEHITRIIVTMDQARKAGWTSNQSYTKTPQDMLWARAAARVCDRIASDVLKGVASVEEVQDSIKVTAAVGKRTVRPRAAAAAIEAGPAEDLSLEDPSLEPDAVDETAATEEGITTAQQKKLHALLRDHGLADRTDGLAYISGVLDRDIESTKALTKLDAMTLIDGLLELQVEPSLDADWPPRDPDGAT